MKNTLCVWLGSAFLLGGCIANHPKDVDVVSIKVLDYQEQAEFLSDDFLSILFREKYTDLIEQSEITVYFQRQASNEPFKNVKSHKPILKLEFTSKENLHKYARDHSYPVSNASYFCDHPDDDSFLLGRPHVYWRGLRVDFPLNYAMPQKHGVPFVYYTFIDVTFTAHAPSSLVGFDLQTDPKDVCFQLRGGFGGRGFASNVVVIPKAEIIKALKNMPPALKQPPAQ